MSNQDSQFLIDNPDYFFDGALPNDSTELCVQILPNRDDVHESDRSFNFEVRLCDKEDGVEAILGIRFSSEADMALVSETTRNRLVCHALIHRLPDEAIGEAVESLTGMFQFYLEVAKTPPSLPMPSRTVRAKVAARRTATVYPVTEE